MVQIGFGVMGAGVAIAPWCERSEILFVLSPFGVDAALRSHQSAVPSDSGWENAVEHIDPAFDAAEDIIERTDPHQIAGFIERKKADRIFNHLEANLFRLAD